MPGCYAGPFRTTGSDGRGDMIRKLLIVMATGICGIGGWTVTAQAAETVVVVESAPAGPTTAYGGTLTRSSASSGPTGFVAVYAGLSVLGFTLVAISRQRRSAMRALEPARTGSAYGRRSRADFWTPPEAERTPTAAASARPVLRTGALPLPRSRGTARPRAGVAPSSGESAAG